MVLATLDQDTLWMAHRRARPAGIAFGDVDEVRELL